MNEEIIETNGEERTGTPRCPDCGRVEVRCDMTGTAMYDAGSKKWFVYDFHVEDESYTICECGDDKKAWEVNAEGPLGLDDIILRDADSLAERLQPLLERMLESDFSTPDEDEALTTVLKLLGGTVSDQ